MKKAFPALVLALALALCSACGTDAPETQNAETTAVPGGTLSENSGSLTPSGTESDGTGSASESAVLTETTDFQTSSEASSESEPAGLAPFVYEFDPYALSSEYAEIYGDGFVEVYRGLADAFINYETSCYCPDEATFTAIMDCLDCCMPYFSSDAVLTYESFDGDTRTLTINYISATREEHNEAYKSFIDEVRSCIDGVVFKNDSKLEAAISVYRNFASSLSYDLGTPDVSVYSAIMDRSGIAHGFAGAYAYLLRQIGIEANICGGLSYDSSAAHEWVVLRLGGSWYYADPTYESGETGGLGLSYFGTNDDERSQAGYDPKYFSVGTTNGLWAYALDVNGTEFSVFRGSSSFTLDRAASEITLSDGSTVPLSQLPGGLR